MERIEFAKPVTIEGTEYTGLDLNFDKLTGDDIIACEREFTATGGVATVHELCKGFLAIVAARAAGVAPDVIRALPAREFSKVTVVAQNFLLD
jgi:hypothetical protein